MSGVMTVSGLQANTTVVDSPWIDGTAFQAPGSQATFEGLKAGDQCELRGSLGQPGPLDQGILIGSVATDGPVQITSAWRWYRFRRTSIAGGGTVNAFLGGFRPPHR